MSDKSDRTRPRGILSKEDREWILADGDERRDSYTRQTRYQRRQAIRERLQNGLLDIALLTEELDDADIEYFLFEDWDESISEVLKKQAAFIHVVAKAARQDSEVLALEGIEEAKESRVDVLRERFERDPESLTLRELSDLYKADEIPEELKDVEIESITNIGFEVSNVLTKLALISEVNGDE